MNDEDKVRLEYEKRIDDYLEESTRNFARRTSAARLRELARRLMPKSVDPYNLPVPVNMAITAAMRELAASTEDDGVVANLLDTLSSVLSIGIIERHAAKSEELFAKESRSSIPKN